MISVQVDRILNSSPTREELYQYGTKTKENQSNHNEIISKIIKKTLSYFFNATL